uniref:CCHC-type domain-containing protein n=1 Tax=Scophthalmus maximus TaxID=52904 RepID=A0A8D3CPA5_SCOMX
MDPAETEQFKHVLSTQGALVSQQEATLRKVMEALQQLTTSVTQLDGRLDHVATQLTSVMTTDSFPPQSTPPAAPPGSQSLLPREPFITIPARYSGDLGTCSQFLHQCSLVFSQQPATYATDQSKTAFIMSLCSDKASAWELAFSQHNPVLCSDYSAFTSEMRRVFDHPVKGKEAVSQLLSLNQGRNSVSQYALDFRILSAECGWDQAALQAVFLKGLSEEIKDELATRDETTSLEELIKLATRLDNRLRERQREKAEGRRARSFSSSTSRPHQQLPTPLRDFSGNLEATSHPPANSEEPMQLGRARLTPAERQRRFHLGLCFYCGQEGHPMGKCPVRPKGEAHQPAGGRW